MNNVFQKRHYQYFADTISEIEGDQERGRITDYISHVFALDNDRFDKERFKEWIRRRRNNESLKGMNPNPKYMVGEFV